MIAEEARHASWLRGFDEWAADAVVLHEIGGHLLLQAPVIAVRVPRRLADLAVAAWRRDEQRHDTATADARHDVVRHEAATLALIGNAIEATGTEDGDEVAFKLDAWLLGSALTTADRAGRPS
jgi:hypothetical protein